MRECAAAECECSRNPLHEQLHESPADCEWGCPNLWIEPAGGFDTRQRATIREEEEEKKKEQKHGRRIQRSCRDQVSERKRQRSRRRRTFLSRFSLLFSFRNRGGGERKN